MHAATRAAHARARHIQLTLPEPMAVRMEEKARAMGRKLTDYARLLLDAAYAARCAIEKGEQTYDAALDRQVRLTFLMADCEAEYIAEALGMPKRRVERILEGWRKVAADLPPEPAKTLLPPEPDRPIDRTVRAAANAEARLSISRSAHGETIARMWANGASAAEIGAAVGSDADGVRAFAAKNRDLCPARPVGFQPKPAERPVPGWPREMVEKVQTLWAERATVKEIAAAIGKSEGAVSMWISKNRDLCPRRREGGNWR